ncbi:MAG: T9SS type A sorting domain-containing protein, partial [Chitinophagaceae bacterium]|nr:T9SS type A sorting domain-containing protein [Chitinophagaceae bacterium]
PSYPSPAATYIAQESVPAQSLYNNASMRFTARNARFLFNEMEVLPNLENCSAECSNPYFIAGDVQTCNTATVFIQGVPRGVNVAWSFSPSNSVTAVANGSSYTITRKNGYSGAATITAVVGPGCNNTTVTLTRVVDIGSPVGTLTFQRYGSSCFYQAVFQTIQTRNNYEWSDDGITYTDYGNINVYGTYYPAPGNNIPVYVRVNNSCGTLTRNRNFTITTSPGGCTNRIASKKGGIQIPVNTEMGSMVVYPNPAAQNITIPLRTDWGTIKSIQIVSGTGTIIYNKVNSAAGQVVTIAVNHLPVGIYTVRVFNGTKWYSQKLIIQR